MTILVVEDSAFVQFVLLELLRDLGYAAVGAEHGQAALTYLACAAELPSLIVLDLMMPTMNGWDLCAALQSDVRLATIPIVVMSARQDVGDQATQLGSADYLSKPFDADALLAIVQRYAPDPWRHDD